MPLLPPLLPLEPPLLLSLLPALEPEDPPLLPALPPDDWAHEAGAIANIAAVTAALSIFTIMVVAPG
jgi:hypothetical protein